jgi:NAD(P)-dependent dehydrogenase (short-subunit alcohol dehydrogenase family)
VQRTLRFCLQPVQRRAVRAERSPILSPGTEKIITQIPLGRLGTPDEVAKIIYVLCTDASSYVNGAEIHINGGQHAGSLIYSIC